MAITEGDNMNTVKMEEWNHQIDALMKKHCNGPHDEVLFMLGLNLGMKISEEINAEAELKHGR